MKVKNLKTFKNGSVYVFETYDKYLIETTDTFLPFYTKNAINDNYNKLKSLNLGSRKERWMIGISCMSGCPVHCKFCATGLLGKYRNLSSQEMFNQVKFVIEKNKKYNFEDSMEHKINYTRMGEPFLNLENVKETIREIDSRFPNVHHYISTIGIKDSDFSWIRDNITLQISLHSLDDNRRDYLIPYKNKMSIEELGRIRTKSNLKTTLNLTLVDEEDFNIDILQKYFDTDCFFIKLSPINTNNISCKNNLGKGIIEGVNLL